MSYSILPNIIFVFSIFGILLIILKHLPAAAKEQPADKEQRPEKKLIEKGLPAQAISKIRVAITTTLKKTWNFILEAKDLKPYARAGYQMKKIFDRRLLLFKKPAAMPRTLKEVKGEAYFLEMIKLQPKALGNYDSLGKLYLEQENINDAKDIYQYLAKHQPSNPEFQARLGYCFYQTKNYERAAQAYQKSLALDSTQPNRYYNLGLSLEAAGKREEAVRAFHKALELEPQNPKFLQAMAKSKNHS